jgi:hypothetical protein
MKLKLVNIKILAYSVGFFVTFFGCNYDPRHDYTDYNTVLFNVKNENMIFADSLTLTQIELRIPGVKYNNYIPVIVNTSWGNWLNGDTTISLKIPYDSNGYYKGQLFLMSGRTIRPFAVEVRAQNLTKEIYLTSIARFPDTVQIISDAQSLSKAPGATCKVKVAFYSSVGKTSYGIKFKFSANENVILDPIEKYFQSPNFVSSLTLPADVLKSDTLIITGAVQGVNKQPVVIPSKIFLKP